MFMHGTLQFMIIVYDALNDSKCEATSIYDVVDTEGDDKVKIKKVLSP